MTKKKPPQKYARKVRHTEKRLKRSKKSMRQTKKYRYFRAQLGEATGRIVYYEDKLSSLKNPENLKLMEETKHLLRLYKNRKKMIEGILAEIRKKYF
ncbi:MAG: hypothetical protein AB1467_03235 [Candidatus Diapherotrites archaeon]